MDYPFYRVSVRPVHRRSYSDETTSQGFKTESEALDFAASMKNMIREVELITGEKYAGYGQTMFISKTIAKWGIKTVNGKRTIGRIK